MQDGTAIYESFVLIFIIASETHRTDLIQFERT